MARGNQNRGSSSLTAGEAGTASRIRNLTVNPSSTPAPEDLKAAENVAKTILDTVDQISPSVQRRFEQGYFQGPAGVTHANRLSDLVDENTHLLASLVYPLANIARGISKDSALAAEGILNQQNRDFISARKELFDLGEKIKYSATKLSNPKETDATHRASVDILNKMLPEYAKKIAAFQEISKKYAEAVEKVQKIDSSKPHKGEPNALGDRLVVGGKGDTKFAFHPNAKDAAGNKVKYTSRIDTERNNKLVQHLAREAITQYRETKSQSAKNTPQFEKYVNDYVSTHLDPKEASWWKATMDGKVRFQNEIEPA